MLKQQITVIAHATVGGPQGEKLIAGTVYEFDDSPYVRVLIESKTVSLVDPPSLDPAFLEKAGYELCEGYSYHEEIAGEEEPVVKTSEEPVVKTPEEPVVKTSEEPVVKTPEESVVKTSEEPIVKTSEEPVVKTSEEPVVKGSDHEPKNLQLTPPIGMGVTTSVEEK